MDVLKWFMAIALLALSGAAGASGDSLPAAPEPEWAAALLRALEAADERFAGDLGVYVHHLGRDEHVSYRAHESWYLASGIKVPVAIAVLRRIENGELRLDSRLRLQAGDIVDGAGATKRYAAGTELRVDFLLDQMIRFSDNTASDVLIRHVGLEEVNSVARELLAAQDLVITSLADVRRLAYSGFHHRAALLAPQDMLALQRAAAGPARVKRLAELLGVSPAEFLLQDLDSAFEAYYARDVNAARLSDFGRMLASLANGLALRPEGTDYLLDLMQRVQTGSRRIKAALPCDAKFAHKTGTQYRRQCDMGIVTTPVDGHNEMVVVAACARGELSLANSERALRDVGAAVSGSGVLRLSSPARSPVDAEASPMADPSDPAGTAGTAAERL
jgi:beta-lactamase class A